MSRNGTRHSSSFDVVSSPPLNLRANPRERHMTNAPRMASSSPSTTMSGFGSGFCQGRRKPSDSDSDSIPRALLIVGPIILLSIFVAYLTFAVFDYDCAYDHRKVRFE